MVILVIRTFFVQFFVFLPTLLNVFSSVISLQFLSFIVPIFAWNVPLVSNFLEISSLSHSISFPLLLCIVHLWGLSYLSLLFFGTLHSIGYIFPFFLSLFFLSQLFVRPPQITILILVLLFLWDGFGHHLLYKESPSIALQALSIRSNPLNLFITSPI